MASGRDWQETYDQKEPRNPKPYALALLWAVIMAPITLLLGGCSAVHQHSISGLAAGHGWPVCCSSLM